MKLQAAIDFGTLDEARAILKDVGDYIDIVEIGNTLVEYGYSMLVTLKKEFPHLEFLADAKISDGGYFCTMQAHNYGADYVTVLGIVENETICGAIKASQETGIKVVVDLIGCKNFYERIRELEAMGVEYINIHTPIDLQVSNHTPFEQVKLARMIAHKAKLSVAGGINPENIYQVIPYKPEIIISGSALTGKGDRRAAAKAMHDAIERAERTE